MRKSSTSPLSAGRKISLRGCDNNHERKLHETFLIKVFSLFSNLWPYFYSNLWIVLLLLHSHNVHRARLCDFVAVALFWSVVHTTSNPTMIRSLHKTFYFENQTVLCPVDYQLKMLLVRAFTYFIYSVCVNMCGIYSVCKQRVTECLF